MVYSIANLLEVIKDKYPQRAKRIASLASLVIHDKQFIKIAQQILDNSIEIDLDELESMTNPKKVHSDPEIPEVSLEDEII